MPRAAFDTTAKFIGGPGTPESGDVLGIAEARFVPIDGVYQAGANHPTPVAYLTVEEYMPRPGWTAPLFGIDPEKADQVAVPADDPAEYWVLYTEYIDYKGRPPYWRAMLMPLPLPEACDCGDVDPPDDPIQTECCDEPIPQTLTAVLSNFGGTCDCINGTRELTYDSTSQRWLWEGDLCGAPGFAEFWCDGGTWWFQIGNTGETAAGEATVVSCDPFEVTFDPFDASAAALCDGDQIGSVVITPA